MKDWDIKITGFDLNENFGNTFRAEDGLLKPDEKNFSIASGSAGVVTIELLIFIE